MDAARVRVGDLSLDGIKAEGPVRWPARSFQLQVRGVVYAIVAGSGAREQCVYVGKSARNLRVRICAHFENGSAHRGKLKALVAMPGWGLRIYWWPCAGGVVGDGDDAREDYPDLDRRERFAIAYIKPTLNVERYRFVEGGGTKRTRAPW